MSERKKAILVLDFDGVIHNYNSGWKSADVANDPPVPGAMHFIWNMATHYIICIHSSRSHQPGGIDCMREYIRFHMAQEFGNSIDLEQLMSALEFPTFKPPAMVTIDDRALRFTGEWPSLEELKAFRPWNKS